MPEFRSAINRVDGKAQCIFLTTPQNTLANNIFTAKKQNQQKIENSQFCKKIPDRLTHQEQSEEQNHSRVGGEEIQQ